MGGSVTMDELVSLCKRRGFIFQSSEIYGGLASAWDYGPLGIELKNRIQREWWKEMTQLHDNIVGLDASIMMHPRVWEASGHVQNFTDPLVDCKGCKTRFREDQLSPEAVESRVCPECGGELTEARKFNLMFTTHMGPVEDDGSLIYLRPETAQGIFVNFRNVVQSSRVKIPFGIAQVGKAFRNEITTKSFIFRTCEFEQMEMQFFVKPGDDEEWFNYWKNRRWEFYSRRLGILPDSLRWHQHPPEALAHYARDAYDIEYSFPFGWAELEGIHNRGDYDLMRHGEFSGKEINYLDDGGERYVPVVIETSAGLSRSVLMVLSDAYEVEDLDGDSRSLLRFHPNLAPVTVGVFPLVKKDGLAELARKIELSLREEFSTFYDQGGAIGRRYRRQDEIGTPYCVTVDYETRDNGTVTLRDRDTMEQVRVKADELSSLIQERIKSYKRKV